MKTLCPDCGYGYFSQDGFDRHRLQRHYQCPLCSRSYIRVRQHMILSHYGPEMMSMVPKVYFGDREAEE